MGTLTANTPRLPDHCPHKLPSSCRLTSTPLCCACYDRRPHQPAYSVYVDGVGFVQRGTRWQNYCWPCMTFWDNRVQAAGMQPRETRIPENPAQGQFVDRWFEFYQGWRMVSARGSRSGNGDADEGREVRVPVLGEPLKEVDPGRLPRSLDELRRRVSISAVEEGINREGRRRRAVAQQTNVTQPAQSLEETLDGLLQDAAAEEQTEVQVDQQSEDQGASRAVQEHHSARRRERERQSTTPGSTIESIRRRDLRAARLLARLRGVFGTAEEIQSDDYVSPITAMENRTWERHRRLQELREAQERLQGPNWSQWWYLPAEAFPRRPMTEGHALGEINNLDIYRLVVSKLEEYSSQTWSEREAFWELLDDFFGDMELHLPQSAYAHTVRGTPLITVVDAVHELRVHAGTSLDTSMTLVRILLSVFRLQVDMAAILQSRMRSRPANLNDTTFKGLDGDDRPKPLEDEQMMVKLECKICLSQIADVALMPCGHLSFCTWCADQILPVHHNDKTRPLDKRAKCPVCRKGVKQRVKIFVN